MISKENRDNDISHGLLVLCYLHSAMCPFLYAYNLKDFQTARSKLFKMPVSDYSMSNKRSKSMEQIDFSDLSYTYSCSEDKYIDEEVDEENPQGPKDTQF
mgnify:CR=1 FL=1